MGTYHHLTSFRYGGLICGWEVGDVAAAEGVRGGRSYHV